MQTMKIKGRPHLPCSTHVLFLAICNNDEGCYVVEFVTGRVTPGLGVAVANTAVYSTASL